MSGPWRILTIFMIFKRISRTVLNSHFTQRNSVWIAHVCFPHEACFSGAACGLASGLRHAIREGSRICDATLSPLGSVLIHATSMMSVQSSTQYAPDPDNAKVPNTNELGATLQEQTASDKDGKSPRITGQYKDGPTGMDTVPVTMVTDQAEDPRQEISRSQDQTRCPAADTVTVETDNTTMVTSGRPGVLSSALLGSVTEFIRQNPAACKPDRSVTHMPPSCGSRLVEDIRDGPAADKCTEPSQDQHIPAAGEEENKEVESFLEAHNNLMGYEKQQSTGRKKRKSKNSSPSHDVKEHTPKAIPNYFVAVQVTNPQIHRRLRMVQDHIVSQKPALSAALVAIPTLHITVLVMNLADDDDITRAQCALDECREKLSHLESDRLVLDFQGVGTFRDNVVFANIADGPEKDRLAEVAAVVREVFTQHGLELTDDRSFKPHLTIMKLSKAPNLRRKGIKKISPSLYEEVREEVFGYQTVRSLQLCAMMRPKNKAGYYHRTHQVDFVSEPDTEPSTDNFEYTSTGEDQSLISNLSQKLATDILTEAMEAIRSDQLAKSRKRKLLNRDTSQKPHKKSKQQDVCAGDRDVLSQGQEFVVDLHKQLSWTFRKGHSPNVEDVKKELEKVYPEGKS